MHISSHLNVCSSPEPGDHYSCVLTQILPVHAGMSNRMLVFRFFLLLRVIRICFQSLPLIVPKAILRPFFLLSFPTSLTALSLSLNIAVSLYHIFFYHPSMSLTLVKAHSLIPSSSKITREIAQCATRVILR